MRNPRIAFIAARASEAALLASMMGCSVQSAEEPAQLGSTRQAAGAFTDTGFNTGASYLPPKTVVLTFDDGPDWNADENAPEGDAKKGNTWKVLDILKEENVKATFFINGDNYSNIDDAEMQENVVRMAAEGHEIASHTEHHMSIGDQSTRMWWDTSGMYPAPDWYITGRDLTADEVESELSTLEEKVDRIFGSGKVRLTLLRAPFGEPFQTNMGEVETAKMVVARHAVHVGWDLDTFDYQCQPQPQCTLDNLKNGLAGGKSAIVLSHSVQDSQSATLSEAIKWLKSEGYTFWTTEQAVCKQFGKYSAEIVDGVDETKCDKDDPQPLPAIDVENPPGDGDTGDGDTGDGDTGDGDTGDGDTGDGDTGDGDTGDGDTGDGDTGDGDSGDGDSGDGDSGDGDSGDGDGDSDNEEDDTGGGAEDDGCSVGHTANPGLNGLFALGLGAAFALRRRRSRR